MVDNIAVFLIVTAVAIIFLLIGINSWKSDKAVGFFTGVNPPEMKDIHGYNHAVGKIWIVTAVLFELLGIPLAKIEQNSPIALLVALGIVFLIIGMVVVYLKVEKKYRK